MSDRNQDVEHEQPPVKRGKVEPDRPVDPQPDCDQLGIEIDNAIERPQEGQPGQPGGKPS